MIRNISCLLGLILCGSSTLALAQARQAPANAEGDVDTDSDVITVTGQRLLGAVKGDIAAEVTLSAGDVRSLGVSSIAELLTELAPQTGSGQGRGGESPVVLLNGKRVSSFSEIRDIPTEAIRRVDILPEEVGLKYGYRANQKVVNIVLRSRFKAVTAEAEAAAPTEGGQFSPKASASLLRIDPAGRLNVALDYAHSSALFESERDIVGDLGRFRTLLPETETLGVNAVLNRTLLGNIATTINGSLRYDGRDSSTTRGGLPVGLSQAGRDYTGHLGLTLAGDIASWQWTLVGNYDRLESRTLTETGVAISPQDRARSIANTGDLQLVTNGTLFALPAGPLAATFTLGDTQRAFSADSIRSGLNSSSDLERNTASGEFNLDIPIASRRGHVLAPIGNLSANFNLALDRHSDFGTLRTIGYGLNWSPAKPINLIVSMTHDQGAPTVQQLGDAQILNTGARVFDYVRGETVDISRLTGGNPDLVADDRRLFKAGLTLKPVEKLELSIVVDYTTSRIDNPIAAFPAATVAIESAFPDRFTRDADGRLLQLDARPINFAREDREELRWGVNFSRRLSAPPPGQRGEPGGQPTSLRQYFPAGSAEGNNRSGGTRGAAGGGFGGGGGGAGGRGTRISLSLYHTWLLRDDILVRSGGPLLDLLGGDLGAQSRHKVEARAGLTRNGLGLRVSGNWQSASTVRGNMADPTRNLDFSDLATLDLRLFANLGQQRKLAERFPLLRGTRLTLSVDNLFDSRQHVRDGNGGTPISYQPDYLDPLGRSVKLSLRKLFF